jgi:hypothetical protein
MVALGVFAMVGSSEGVAVEVAGAIVADGVRVGVLTCADTYGPPLTHTAFVCARP